MPVHVFVRQVFKNNLSDSASYSIKNYNGKIVHPIGLAGSSLKHNYIVEANYVKF